MDTAQFFRHALGMHYSKYYDQPQEGCLQFTSLKEFIPLPLTIYYRYLQQRSFNSSSRFSNPRLFSFIVRFFPERNPIANALPLLIRFAWWNLGANRI